MDKVLMDNITTQRALMRISHEILERNKGVKDLVLIGIHTGGSYLCKHIASNIEKIEGYKPKVGSIDITLYRDDLKRNNPVIEKTDINFSIEDKKVVLIDDVLFTGRTIRGALDALRDYGRPKFVQLAVLIDRGHRELPIRADYVGKNIPTSLLERVKVTFDGEKVDEVILKNSNGGENE